MTLQGVVSSNVRMDAMSIRSHAYYLTKIRKKCEPCWLVASIPSRSICIYTGGDERHVIRSLRWADVLQAVPSTRDPVFHIVMVNRTHHIRALDDCSMRMWVCALNSVTDNQ